MIRPADDSESRKVFSFFEEFASGSSQELFDEFDIWVVEEDNALGVLMITMDMRDMPIDVLRAAEHGGMRIGTLEGDDFHLDLQGAMLLASVSRDMSVRVNEQAARMYLYGKDVLGESVLSWPRGLGTGDACIVVNPRWEALGIGEIVMRGAKGQRPAVSPVHDLGTYLRDQGAE